MPAVLFVPLVPLRVIALLAGLLVAVVLLPWIIEMQRRSRLGQQVYEDAPQSHAAKTGTPTMGGIVFAIAALAGYAVSGLRASLPLLVLVGGASAIGLADDLLIIRTKRAVGLRAREKFFLSALLAAGYVWWVGMRDPASTFQTWFFGEAVVLPAWLWYALAVLAVVGAAHAVNLTDGLDGLAAGATIPALVGLQLTALYLRVPGGSTVADAALGALLGFFWYNRHPARIFMGDTGSLALGALLAGVAIESHALLLLPLFGIVFVIEALSVMAQVVSFKTTGRRVFRMSPLHHHFELSGWRETTVSSTFISAGVLAAAATWMAWWSTSNGR